MSFVSKRNSYDLQNFINRPFEFHIVLFNYDQAVSDYGTIDLYPYGILACTPELLDFELLFEPFEE